MKKFMCVIAAAAVLISFTGCEPNRETPDESVSIRDMYPMPKNADGEDVMFVYRISNCGEVNTEEDYWISDTYSIHYNGRIELAEAYNLTCLAWQEAYMSYEDLETIYALASQFMYTHEPNLNEYISCDAPSYSFTLYDENGVEHDLLYTDHLSEEMGDIAQIISAYFPDENPSPTPVPVCDVIELSDEWSLRVSVTPFDASGTAYVLNSDATLTGSGGELTGQTAEINPDDLCTVEDFISGVLDGNIDNPQSLDAPDGVIYSFIYTGEDGAAHVIYTSGVLEGEALEVYEILSSYFE